MFEDSPATELHHIDTASMFRLVAVQISCLCAVGLIAIGALSVLIFQWSAQGLTGEWIGMTLDLVVASVGCLASLAFSIARPLRIHLAASRILACTASIPAVLVLTSRFRVPILDLYTVLHPNHGQSESMPPVMAVAFVLLAVVICLIHARKGITSYIADVVAFALGLLTLAMVSEWLFTVTRVFDGPYVRSTPPASLGILALLVFVAFSARAQYGAFYILVGSGLGSRIARALTPVVLTLPFLREAGRARITRLHLLPEHSEAATLATIAAMISFGMVLLVAQHIRKMEGEIRRLSLRDELTDLYNLRGFRLLAEQSLRLAYRSQTPFSVLFVDLDGLKQINDTFGHAVGSALLVETAELLKTSFRETDVIARIGGDEFAIAGQFSHSGILLAAQRLEDQASLSRAEACGGKPLSLSIGCATTAGRRRGLQELLDEADSNMYGQKREKRLQVC